jgi:sugar phosphate isomerase/epimerase
MHCTRREALAIGLGSAVALAARAETPKARLGVVIHSYPIRRFTDPLAFLEYCQALGAGGVQTSFGTRDEAYAAKVRAFAEKHKLYVEGSIALPRDRDDVERFAAEVRTAQQCGASVFRTVLMTGRRYEVFGGADAFRTFLERGRQSLALARPIIEKQRLRMAVENHKDLRTPELLEVIKKLDSPWIGVCVDTGNNIALLEAPQETVDLLAPHAFSVHLKDMGVAEYADGFLLSEVPLGTGFLDLPKIIATLRKARPEVRFNLEMITRDPLKVPCLTDKYWATLEEVHGKRLAAALTMVRSHAAKQPLPRVSTLTKEEQLRREDDNVRQCLRHAREKLDL